MGEIMSKTNPYIILRRCFSLSRLMSCRRRSEEMAATEAQKGDRNGLDALVAELERLMDEKRALDRRIGKVVKKNKECKKE